MSKKRKREVDVELVQVYQDLADDREDVRLNAAHILLSKIYKPQATSAVQTKTILTRLFRGLCSGRKAARLGFSVALTELLSQVPLSSEPVENALSVSHVIDILDTQTIPEGGTSGQDERDHYFGRVFGADVVLKSGVLFKDPDQTLFKRLLDLVCGVATKKPWLRQECGWILYVSISTSHNDLPETFAVEIIESLATNRLIRTPEGVAIWLATMRRFPQAKLLASVWKHDDPLAIQDVKLLADILKDARAQPDQSHAELDAQGSARWSANLHFAWDVVLDELFRDPNLQPVEDRNGSMATSNKRVSFDLFWRIVVDESLFSSTSSTERKAWGFSLWRKVFETAPVEYLQYTFSSQARYWLVNSLKGSERFLQKRASKVSQTFRVRLVATDSGFLAQRLTETIFKALLESVSYGDFDQITKTKTLQSLVEIDSEFVSHGIYSALNDLIRVPVSGEDRKGTLTRQKAMLSLQWKFILARLRHKEQKGWSEEDLKLSDEILVFKSWLREVCVSPTSKIPEEPNLVSQLVLLAEAREFAKERLGLAFEQTLRLGPVGCLVLKQVIPEIPWLESRKVQMAVVFETEIQTMVQKAWQRLTNLPLSGEGVTANGQPHPVSLNKPSQQQVLSFTDGLFLLYSLVLFQIYSGEPEAVQTLQDLLEYHETWENETEYSAATTEHEPADSIVEILLTFASRPSKFLRRITTQVFDAFAPYMTPTGLDSLCRILATKENVQGQQEMFGAEPDEENADFLITNSDVEDVDSDVEVGTTSIANDSQSDSDLSLSGDSDEDSDQQSGSSEEEGEDEELAKFDAALASALGTRALDQTDLVGGSDAFDSSSDEDMNDDQMMELDSKLAEVFRARNEEQSKNKKKEAKEAKENVVNFKNRVLDLIESYLKHQSQNPFTVELIVPLLTLMRTTQTKQLADHACNILLRFCSRCKGTNVPELKTNPQIQHALDVLKIVHQEASIESSNAHANAASQSSILLVKTLATGSPESVRDIVDIYASTRLKQLTTKKCRILPAFFTDWNNWCQTAKEKLAK